MKHLLKITGSIELATGLALIAGPAVVGRLLLGSELAGAANSVARVAGIALVSLGIACWPGREAGGTELGGPELGGMELGGPESGSMEPAGAERGGARSGGAASGGEGCGGAGSGGAGSAGVWGMLTYNALVAGYFVCLGIAGEHVGPLLWPAALLHGVITILFLIRVKRTRRGRSATVAAASSATS